MTPAHSAQGQLKAHARPTPAVVFASVHGHAQALVIVDPAIKATTVLNAKSS